MHCVKVDNVINEFQMLANSQFVENRVYDEEVEDIMANGNSVQNDETNSKPKDEDISTKIKVALNIGLNFLNERFDCSSQSVPQNDSDDENDQILEGLISNSARDQYSQRLLPYIIGSDDFAKDNYVGLRAPEENPIIDLNSRAQADRLSAQSVESVESEVDTFDAPSALPNTTNHLIPNMNDTLDDSEDESTDLFGSIPQSSRAKAKPLSSESESDTEPFLTEEKPSPKPRENLTNESKPPITSFHDELSAVIGGRRPEKPVPVNEETNKEPVVNNRTTEPILTPTLDSESSDESDSIFNVKKAKPKGDDKQKNFSNLFGDEANDDSLFAPKTNKPSAKDLAKTSAPKIPAKTTTLFDDDDEDDDDLFSAAFSKKKPQQSDPVVNKPVVNETLVSKPIDKSNVPAQIKPKAISTSLFNDDDDEEDDLFSGISSKPKPSPPTVPLNSESPEPEVKPTVTSALNKPKPNNSLIGELNAALKKKHMFPSSDEDSDKSKSDDESSEEKVLFANKQTNDQNDDKPVSLKDRQDSKDSLFDDPNAVNYVQADEVKPSEEIIPDEKTSIDTSNEDLLASEPTIMLANDGLKHRASLGAQRQRRPPTKRVVRMAPATDFGETQSTSQVREEDEEKSKPVAAVRTVKSSNDSNARTVNDIPHEPENDLLVSRTSKSIASLIKSPSTEEDDIFPTQLHTKNLNINPISEKSENNLFEDSGDDSLFSSNKTIRNNNSKKPVDSRGLFDTSESDDEDILSSKPSNIISNIIKPSKSNEFFNDVSSTDSSLSNKSDLKSSVSRPAVSLFSDSDDDDLFTAVNKSKSVEKKEKDENKPTIIETPVKKPIEAVIEKKPDVKTNSTLKKTDSLFSDDDEDTDLFANTETKKEIKVNKSTQNFKTNRKPVFALDDSDSDEGLSYCYYFCAHLTDCCLDLFASKTSKPNTTQTSTANRSKPEPKRKDSDLFDDPLFASRS